MCINMQSVCDSQRDERTHLSLGVPVVDDVQEAVRAHSVAHLDSQGRPTLRRASLREVDDRKRCPFYCKPNGEHSDRNLDG